MPHTTNYFNTFIAVAEDCPVTTSEVPPTKEPASAAQIEFAMLDSKPYCYTSDEVLYAANGKRRGLSQVDFFSKGQPCFRSSPLTRRYGWGIHADADGKLAIYPVDSAEYKRLVSNSDIKQLKAMRSKRA
ncbi:hypothetical protein JNM87_06785 [Candidatus Saccharibacteria bacterium]|nr:hypothetical protein [Candidatus Saccharibacteria bacterium]